MGFIKQWLPYVLAGISAGGQYALIAIGYTLVYGILRFCRLAVPRHGGSVHRRPKDSFPKRNFTGNTSRHWFFVLSFYSTSATICSSSSCETPPLTNSE